MKKLKKYADMILESNVEQIELEWELNDERFSITYEEFLKEIPWNYLDKEIGSFDFGVYIPGGEKSYVCAENLMKMISCPIYQDQDSNFPIEKGFENNLEYYKRNLCMRFSYITSGSSGGSCWGDEAEYFENDDITETEFIETFKSTLREILRNHLESLTLDELVNKLKSPDWTSDIIKEGSYTDWEYYGNYDNIGFYYITFYDLYKFLGYNSTF